MISFPFRSRHSGQEENRLEGRETEASADQFHPRSHEMEIVITGNFFFNPCSEKQPIDRHHPLLKTKPLPSIKSLGPPPPKPPKPPVVNLQAFRRQAAAISETHREGKEMHRALHTAPMPLSPPSPLAPSPRQLPGDNAQLLFHGAGHPSLVISRTACGSLPVK